MWRDGYHEGDVDFVAAIGRELDQLTSFNHNKNHKPSCGSMLCLRDVRVGNLRIFFGNLIVFYENVMIFAGNLRIFVGNLMDFYENVMIVDLSVAFFY